MKVKIKLSKLSVIKIEGITNIFGVLSPIVVVKIVETLKKIQNEHNLKG